MPPLGSRDDPSVVDELLQQGLTLYAANRVEQAVARWRQVLELAPGEPRALDYLASAGYPLAEGTGQEAPVGPGTQAPDTDEIAVFEVAPISHQSGWPRTASAASPSRPSEVRPAPRRRVPLFVPWAVIAGLTPVVAYLAVSLFRGGDADSGAGAVVPSPRSTERGASAAQVPAPSVTPGEQPAEDSDDLYVVELTVIPSNAVIELDGQRVARGDYVARFERDGTTHRIEVSAPGYRTRELTFVDEAPPTRIKLVATERGRASARKARRAQRSEGERGSKARREEEPAAETPPEPPAPPPAPVRRSDNINPWASPQ